MSTNNASFCYNIILFYFPHDIFQLYHGMDTETGRGNFTEKARSNVEKEVAELY
jgi:hypothetical protein